MPLTPAYAQDAEQSPQDGNWTSAAAHVHDLLEPDTDVEDSGDALNRSLSSAGGWAGGTLTPAYPAELGTVTPAYHAILTPAYHAELGSSSHMEPPSRFGRSPSFSAAAAARAAAADLSSSGGGAHAPASVPAAQAWPNTGPYADPSFRVTAKRGYGETAIGVKSRRCSPVSAL